MTLRREATLSVPHGVAFLYDPTAIIDVPADTAAAPVLATNDCVSLWTVHEEEGPTSLVLTDTYEDHDCNLVFQGSLKTVGRKLAFNTSSCEPIVQLDVGAEAAEVSIYANDASEPSKVVCVVTFAVTR